LKSFEKDYNLVPSEWKNNPSGLASRNANITSTGILGAAFGAFISLKLVDRFGPLRCWQLFVLTWAWGLFMMIFSSGIFGLLIFARVVSGIGAGGLTVVGPLHLFEIAQPGLEAWL
jgi:MFS family permease